MPGVKYICILKIFPATSFDYPFIIMRNYILLFLLFSAFSVESQIVRKQMNAIRADIPPRIDGSLSDASWAKAEPISDFDQYLPKHGVSPSFPTEVRIVYDDQAI